MPNNDDALDAELKALLTYLDNSCVALPGFGCFVALSEDKTTIFECPMLVDGTAERDSDDPSHMDWGEVTAPESEFLDRVNKTFGTSFKWENFSGR